MDSPFINNFFIKQACNVIRKNQFKIITLQFPDEISTHCVDIYESFYDELDLDINTDYSLFIAIDSTYGSSIDDVSALHIESHVIVYFGSDLSSSGSIPVIVLPHVKSIATKSCVDKILTSIKSAKLISTSVTSNKFASFAVFYDPSHSHDINEICANLTSQLTLSYPDRQFSMNAASLPPCADLSNWSKEFMLQPSQCLVGGLIIDKSFVLADRSKQREDGNENESINIYIGDKKEQLQSIFLLLSQTFHICYSPSSDTVSCMYGHESREFTQRSGGMLRVKDANTIGIIIGSMGLTGESTQLIVKRLQLLIEASGRKHYTFAMGRLNEAKLSNFPEIDIFCLISNDDSSMIASKTFHAPVITPWELELGLGAREWQSVFNSNAAAILTDDLNNNHHHTSSDIPPEMETITQRHALSLSTALKLVMLNKQENNIDDDSDMYKDDDHENYENSEIINRNNADQPQQQQQQQQLIKSDIHNRQMVKHAVTPSDFYLSKEYKGLLPEVSEEREKDVGIHKGQTGIPSNYTY